MSLIVSVRSAEGIVIAGDSLASTTTTAPVAGDISLQCGGCGETTNIPGKALGVTSVRLNSFPNAIKVFPFLQRFGVGTFGAGVVIDQTIYFVARQLEQAIGMAGKEMSVQDCAEAIGTHFQTLLNLTPGPKAAPLSLGFHVNGYDNQKPVTVTVNLIAGQEGSTQRHDETYFYTVGGIHDVVQALNQHYQGQGGASRLASLGDARGFAEFLLRTTIDFQRFGVQIPSVGGEIALGLITPTEGFTWIQKPNILAMMSSEEGSGA